MSSLIPVVEQVVGDKVQQGEMFTAHDVTLEVRARGHLAGHAEIRSAVHDYFNRGGMGVAYTRSIITVPGGGTPFLYHRLVDDPATFANVRGLNTNVPTSATIAVPPLSAIVNDGDGDDNDSDSDDNDDDDDGIGNSISLPPNFLGNLSVQPAVPVQNGASNKPGQVNSRQVDDRGTLSIPTNLVRGAGFRTYQKVYAFSNGSGTLVVDATKPVDGIVHEYTVDSHDQVRVTQKCLVDAGIPGKNYNLELNANSQILVKVF